MNFVFFGTSDFAAIILEKLIKAGFAPGLVVCNPDRPVGRKKIITPPPVKTKIMNYELGTKKEIKIFQPEKIDKNFLDSLFLIYDSFDFGIVASYAKIIPKSVIDLFSKGIIGIHPSLLPKYRGPSPIQSVILNGEAETGVTLYLLDEKVDHGQIFAQRVLKNYEVGTANYEKLHDVLANLGAELLVEIMPEFLNGKIKTVPQNENKVIYTKKFTTEDARVDLERNDPLVIEKKVRALNPEPGVWTVWKGGKPLDTAQGKRVKILEVKIIDGKLKLKKIQLEGRKPSLLT